MDARVSRMMDRLRHYRAQKIFGRKSDNNDPFSGSINNSVFLLFAKNTSTSWKSPINFPFNHLDGFILDILRIHFNLLLDYYGWLQLL